MARTIGFPFAFAGSHSPHLVAPLSLEGVAPSERATYVADMARTIPFNTVSRAIRVFAAMNGERFEAAPTPTADAVVIPLPDAAVAPAWRAAVIVNLVDFAFATDDPELRLNQSATLHDPALADVSVAGLMDALATATEAARATMTKRLPEGFWLDEYEGGNWPSDSEEYVYEVVLSLSRALTAAEASAMGVLLEDLEMIVAWMGFATEGSAQEWVDAGKMVYPGETEIAGATITWSAERPPSDIAPALLIAEAILERAGVTVQDWKVTIHPGD